MQIGREQQAGSRPMYWAVRDEDHESIRRKNRTLQLYKYTVDAATTTSTQCTVKIAVRIWHILSLCLSLSSLDKPNNRINAGNVQFNLVNVIDLASSWSL